MYYHLLIYSLSCFTRYFKTSGTNHVSSLYNVAPILWVKYKVHVILFPTINVLRFFVDTLGRRYALSNMAVCCRHLMKCFQGLLFGYFLNEFQMVPYSLSICCTRVFTSHACCITIVRPLILKFFRHLPAPHFYILHYNVYYKLYYLSRIIKSGFFLSRIFVSFFVCWFHN